MPTNEERREAAARLRGIVEKTWYTSWHELYTIKNACGCYDEHDSQDMVLKDRLADLIEPEPERTCSIHETDHEYEDSVRCSACRMTFNRPWEPFKYCPNCGAKVVDE